MRMTSSVILCLQLIINYLLSLKNFVAELMKLVAVIKDPVFFLYIF